MNCIYVTYYADELLNSKLRLLLKTEQKINQKTREKDIDLDYSECQINYYCYM